MKCLSIDRAGISAPYVARLLRTYEPSRRTELAATAVAGLAPYNRWRPLEKPGKSYKWRCKIKPTGSRGKTLVGVSGLGRFPQDQWGNRRAPRRSGCLMPCQTVRHEHCFG